MATRKSKNYGGVVVHKDLGIRFDIVGAKTCSIGPCFVVIEEGDLSRHERIFQKDMFDSEDFPSVVRDALFLELVEKESKRVMYKIRKRAAEERSRHEQARRESEAEYEPDESLQPIEDSEIILDEDAEAHEQLPEVEEELLEDE